MNSAQKLKIGILGAGLMGYWHARGATRSGAEITAICDVHQQAADRLSRRFPDAKSWIDFEKMLGEAKIDILHICTPAATHFAAASEAIAHGLHVIIEKPMAPTFEETTRLYDMAARQNVVISPVHQFLFQPGTLEARARLPEIGRLLRVETTFCSAGAAGMTGAAMNDIVGEILPHPLSLMELFLPGSLENSDWKPSLFCDGEFSADRVFNETAVSILISMNSRPTVCAMRLFGTKGTIHIDFFHGFCVLEGGQVSKARKILRPFYFSVGTLGKATTNLARRAISSEPAYPGLNKLIELFYDAARNGKSPPVGSRETLNVAKIRDSLLLHAGTTPS